MGQRTPTIRRLLISRFALCFMFRTLAALLIFRCPCVVLCPPVKPKPARRSMCRSSRPSGSFRTTRRYISRLGRDFAIREIPIKTGPRDYLLFVERRPVDAIMAKNAGTTLSGVSEQSPSYAENPTHSTSGGSASTRTSPAPPSTSSTSSSSLRRCAPSSTHERQCYKSEGGPYYFHSSMARGFTRKFTSRTPSQRAFSEGNRHSSRR